LMFSFNCAFTYSADGSRSSCKLNNGKWLLWPFRTASSWSRRKVLKFSSCYTPSERHSERRLYWLPWDIRS